MRRRVVLMLVMLALLLPTAASQAQGDNPTMLVDMAIAYLSTQLGRPIARADLSDWGWQETYWADASMDCPQPGMTYAQEMTRGYTITLVYLGTRYELHTSPTGDILRLCDSEILEPTPIPTAETPTQLLPLDDRERLADTLIAYLGIQLYGRPLGRENMDGWTWREVLWNDTSMGCPREGQVYEAALVRGYVFTLTYAGVSYELHATPDGSTIIPCNNERLQPVSGFSLEDALASAPPEPAAPPSQPAAEQPAEGDQATDTTTGVPTNGPAASLAYTGQDGNAYLATISGLPGQPITMGVAATLGEGALFPTFDHVYGTYRWSPDGISLVFVDHFTFQLFSTDFQGSAPVALVDNVAPTFPPAWHYTSTEVAYVVPTGTASEEQPAEFVAIYAIEPPVGDTGGSEPRLIATVEYGVGCGGGSADPAEYPYNLETGYMGNTAAFYWLPDDTFLFSQNCTGIGLARLDSATGEVATVAPDLARISLSPDNRHVAGVAIDENGNRQLVRISLDDGTRQVIPVNFTPDRVLWSRDGQRLYVSSIDLVETLESADGMMAFVYQVQLWAVALSDGSASLLFEREGRGIGQMTEAPDRGGLVFSFIDSARAVLEAVESGGDLEAQREAAPVTRLFFMDPDGQLFALGQGEHPAFQPVALSPTP